MKDLTVRAHLRIASTVHALREHSEGASMVEYALLLALIVVVAFAAVMLVGTVLQTRYESIATSVVDASGSVTVF